jgi:hypothetical protein
MRACPRQAKNKTLEIDAAEIRMRAERRIGEMMAMQRETEGFNRGLKGSIVTGMESIPAKDDRPTLAEAGIDKNLAISARKLAAVPKEKFESMVGEWRARVQEETQRVTTNLIRVGNENKRRPSAQMRRDSVNHSTPQRIARLFMSSVTRSPCFTG